MTIPVTGLESQVRERLQDVLEEVQFARLKGWKKDTPIRGGRVDLALDLRVAGERWQLFVEVKNIAEPRLIRGAIQQLQSYLSGSPRTSGVVASPYISARAAEICKASGIGFIDLA